VIANLDRWVPQSVSYSVFGEKESPPGDYLAIEGFAGVEFATDLNEIPTL
jgi:hypothetical protein